MVAVILGLNIVGWLKLAAAVGGHYHITGGQVGHGDVGVTPLVQRAGCG